MKVLVACEYSGRVREAFRKNGHDAYSCDLRPAEDGSIYHYKGDVLNLLRINPKWDLMIAHPYCTFNTLAGIRWMYHPDDTELPSTERRRHPSYPTRMDDFLEGVAFFKALMNADIPKICIENSQPHGLAMEHLGRYTQIVQPWMFGEPFTKGAALWLKGLPKLHPMYAKHQYDEIVPACHYMSPGPDRERERSRTYQGIADAMANQWGRPW